MNTKVVRIKEEEKTRETLEKNPGLLEAAEILKNGGLVAFPTETVYGLGANALNEEAAKKIYAAKGRPSDNPLIAHISCMEELPAIVKEIPEAGRKLAEKYWPGPLTMIFPKKDIVPYGTTGGLDTVAVRMPVDPVANCLIYLAGVPIAGTECQHFQETEPDKGGTCHRGHGRKDRDDHRRRRCGNRRGIHYRGCIRRDPDTSPPGRDHH